MLQSAPLTFEAVAERMAIIVARGLPPAKCWLITVPASDQRGIRWDDVLAGLWQETLRRQDRTGTAMRFNCEEAAAVGDDRVLALVGVRWR